MNPLQIGALIVGGLVILSYFVDFKRIFLNMSKVKNNSDDIPSVIKSVANNSDGYEIVNGSLSNLVAHWEALKSMCDSQQLAEASSKLEEVFPLFIKKG